MKRAMVLMALSSMAISAMGCAKKSEPAAAAAAPKPALSAGQKVAAKWTDNAFWEATVQGVAGDKVSVKWNDGTVLDVPAADVVALSGGPKPSVGQPVLAVWGQGGKLYPGVAKSVTATGVLVAWADGSTPTEIAAELVVPAPKPTP